MASSAGKRTHSDMTGAELAVQRLAAIAAMARGAHEATRAAAAASEKAAAEALAATDADDTYGTDLTDLIAAAGVAAYDARLTAVKEDKARVVREEAEERLRAARLGEDEDAAESEAGSSPTKRAREASAEPAPLPSDTCDKFRPRFALGPGVHGELEAYDYKLRAQCAPLLQESQFFSPIDTPSESDGWIAFKTPMDWAPRCLLPFEYYRSAFGGAGAIAHLRVVIAGTGEEWDTYEAPENDAATVVVLDPSVGGMMAFANVARWIARNGGRASDSWPYRVLPREEGALFYALDTAEHVDVLCLCSGMYRDCGNEALLVRAFAALLSWAQRQAPRVTFTASDWAAEFLAANFEKMTQTRLGFGINRLANDDRTVTCVADAATARGCPLTALALAGECADDGAEIRFDIHEMDFATEVAFHGGAADDKHSDCVTAVYMCEDDAARTPAVWTTRFYQAGNAEALTIVWSTKHLSEVRTVRGLDRERSASTVAATLGDDWADRIRDADDDGEVADIMSQAVSSFAPGSVRPLRATTSSEKEKEKEKD